MANEKIEIDIVLNDGSIAKGFAAINKEAQKTQGILSDAFSVFGGLQLNQAVNALGNTLKGFFQDAIKEATEGQNAINALANSMRAAGTLTEPAIKSFQKLADTLQDTTRFSDDQIIAGGALARNFAKTNEQAEKLVRSAVELSVVTKQDLTTSIEQLGGTLSGSAGRLGKVVPGLNQLKESALRSGEALDLVLKRFSGSAAQDVQTFEGSIILLKNQFNDFLETIGNLFIRSPALLAVFDSISKVFTGLTSSLDTLKSENKDVLGPIIAQAIQFAIVFNQSVVKPFEILVNVVKVTYNVVKQFFDFFVSGLGNIAGIAGKLISFFDKDNSIANALLTFNESSQATYLKQVEATAAAGANAFNTSFSDTIDNTLAGVANSVAAASKTLTSEVKITSGKNNPLSNIVPSIDKQTIEYQINLAKIKSEAILMRDSLEAIGQQDYFGTFSSQLALLPDQLAIANAETQTAAKIQLEQLTAIKNKIKEISGQIGSAIQNGLTNAVSSGVQTVVEALMTGKNAFKAFLGTILGVFGDLAIQIGTTLIGIGIGIDAIKTSLATLTGGFAIAAGVALVAVGSLLKGFAGGLGGKVSSPGSSITAPGTAAQPVSGIGDNLQDRQAGVQVVVQGNVFDSDSTGLRIANILKEVGFTNSVVT